MCADGTLIPQLPPESTTNQVQIQCSFFMGVSAVPTNRSPRVCKLHESKGTQTQSGIKHCTHAHWEIEPYALVSSSAIVLYGLVLTCGLGAPLFRFSQRDVRAPITRATSDSRCRIDQQEHRETMRHRRCRVFHSKNCPS